MSSSSHIPKKRTLTIDDESMRILREYGVINNGNNNVSAAIRSMARDWMFRHAIDKQNNDIRVVKVDKGVSNELTTSRW